MVDRARCTVKLPFFLPLLLLGFAGRGPSASLEPTADACSVDGSTRVSIAVINTSATASYEVYWVDYECEEVYKGSIGPGERWDQRTYLSHPWHIRDADTGELVQEFVTTANTPVITFVK
jgi:hypothetical protein